MGGLRTAEEAVSGKGTVEKGDTKQLLVAIVVVVEVEDRSDRTR